MQIIIHSRSVKTKCIGRHGNNRYQGKTKETEEKERIGVREGLGKGSVTV